MEQPPRESQRVCQSHLTGSSPFFVGDAMDMMWLLQGDDVMRAEKLAVRNTRPRGTLLRATLRDVLGGRLQAPPHAVPIGTVEFVRALMARHGIAEPAPVSYPGGLTPFLGRDVALGRYGDAADGQFVKPAATTKLFTGHIKGDPAYANELSGVPRLATARVWISEPVRFVAEARHYIFADRCVGWSRYDENEDKTKNPDPEVANVAARLLAGTPRPCGYAIDIGLTEDGRTLLIECNDGWALGYYGGDTMSAESYAQLIAARWLEIAQGSLPVTPLPSRFPGSLSDP